MAKRRVSRPVDQLRRYAGIVKQAQRSLDKVVADAAPAVTIALRRTALAEAQADLKRAEGFAQWVAPRAGTQKPRRAPRPEKAQLTVTPQRLKPAKSRQPKPGKISSTGSDRGLSVDSGIRYSADPDADKRTVWIFKTGTTFHRRDCQVVESRDGAIEISVAKAKKRSLTRCMHCVPTVR